MPDNDSTDSPTSDFGTPFRALLDHCEATGLTFSADRETQRIKLKLVRQHALYNCSFCITNEERIVQIHINHPVLAKDEKMRPAVMEFLTRANFGLVIGNFEMDLRDGEISYHVGHVIAGQKLDDETIRGLVTTALATSDKYFPALMCLMFAGHTPEDAVFLAELDTHSEHVEDAPAHDDPAPGAKLTLAKKPPEPKTVKKKPALSPKKSPSQAEKTSPSAKPPGIPSAQPNPHGEIPPVAPEQDPQ